MDANALSVQRSLNSGSGTRQQVIAILSSHDHSRANFIYRIAHRIDSKTKTRRYRKVSTRWSRILCSGTTEKKARNSAREEERRVGDGRDGMPHVILRKCRLHCIRSVRISIHALKSQTRVGRARACARRRRVMSFAVEFSFALTENK